MECARNNEEPSSAPIVLETVVEEPSSEPIVMETVAEEDDELM
ncbi:hypothetical protein Tco_1527741, partial [Tanacetum coccineum]